MGADLLEIDFRWTQASAPVEQISGMSESLADGLVSRFTEAWRHEAEAARDLGNFPGRVFQKRASLFRSKRDFLLRVIPRDLQIYSVSSGSHTGKDKRADFLLVYVRPGEDQDCLHVCAALLSARDANVESIRILSITRHALVRLFQRLKTSNDKDVLREVAFAVQTYVAWGNFYQNVLATPKILVPTPEGALVVQRDERDDGFACIGKTWISDARMHDSERKLAVVMKAREEAGFVLMANDRYVVISDQRLQGGRSSEAAFSCIRSQL